MQREILTLAVQPISEKWVQFQWPKDWANMEFMIDLSFLELIPIPSQAVIANARWQLYTCFCSFW
jgi:hypothetical protein